MTVSHGWISRAQEGLSPSQCALPCSYQGCTTVALWKVTSDFLLLNQKAVGASVPLPSLLHHLYHDPSWKNTSRDSYDPNFGFLGFIWPQFSSDDSVTDWFLQRLVLLAPVCKKWAMADNSGRMRLTPRTQASQLLPSFPASAEWQESGSAALSDLYLTSHLSLAPPPFSILPLGKSMSQANAVPLTVSLPPRLSIPQPTSGWTHVIKDK